MSAVSLPLRFHALGNEDLAASLVVVNKTITSLEPNQLLIRVTHCSVNYVDCKVQHVNVFQLPMPVVLGFDIAGTVVAVGSQDAQSDDIGIGADIMGLSGMSGGGFSEYVVLPRSHVVLRRGVPSREGCAYGVAFSTAYEGLEMEMNISAHSGKTILIPGAAGGCGHFAVQIAKRAGLRVIGTTSQPAGIELLKSLGVDHIIDYVQQDVSKEVFALTDGNGVDFVWDSTGNKSCLEQSVSLVTNGGVWCVLGTAQTLQRAGVDYDVLAKKAHARGAVATYSDWGRWLSNDKSRMQSKPNVPADVLNTAVQYWNDGTVKSKITMELPFEAAALQQILDKMAAGKRNVGKVVMKVA